MIHIFFIESLKETNIVIQPAPQKHMTLIS